MVRLFLLYMVAFDSLPMFWLSGILLRVCTGTTAAGLQAGKPTMICPFFGDQYFWGEMVVRAGVGVAPIPIYLLTSDNLATAFEQLTAPQLALAAQAMQQRILAENGVKGAAEAFRKHLPVQVRASRIVLFHIWLSRVHNWAAYWSTTYTRQSQSGG